MPVILAILTAAGAAAFWLYRMRGAADAAREAGQMGRDVIGAARQWNFKRRTDVHPVDAIDEAAVAKGALATAFSELDDLPTAEGRAALLSRLDVTRDEADELAVLGHWLVGQCGGPAAAIPRLGRRLAKLDGPRAVEEVAVLVEVTAQGDPSERQQEALADLVRRHGAR